VRGLDTNVIIRYLTLDHSDQSEVATAVFEDAARHGDPLFVSTVVMCEIVWVLESAYGYARSEVEMALDAILRTAHIHFSDKDLLWKALGDYRASKGDFADFVIGRDGSAEGCASTLTFDRSLGSSPLFDLL